MSWKYILLVLSDSPNCDFFPQPPLSEKEEFERVLAGLPANPSPLPPVGATVQQNTIGQSEMRSDDMQKLQGQGSTGITADLVGELMMTDPSVNSR